MNAATCIYHCDSMFVLEKYYMTSFWNWQLNILVCFSILDTTYKCIALYIFAEYFLSFFLLRFLFKIFIKNVHVWFCLIVCEAWKNEQKQENNFYGIEVCLTKTWKNIFTVNLIMFCVEFAVVTAVVVVKNMKCVCVRVS